MVGSRLGGWVCSFALLGLGAFGCGNSTSTASGATGSTGSGGGSSSSNETGTPSSTNTSSATTSSTTSGTASDLSGTWDLIVSDNDGDASTATITLSPTLLEVVAEDVDLLAIIGDQEINIAYDDEAVDATRQTPSALDLGILPLPISGALHFAAPPDTQSCDTNLEAGSFAMTCSRVRAPGDLPRLDYADVTATRSESLPSVFGDLGGRWSYQDTRYTCSIVAEGNTLTIDCTGGRDYTGNATIVVDGDRITGSTNGGLEFTAQRR